MNRLESVKSVNKIIVIMLSNTADEDIRDMTDNALNSMWQHKGKSELYCVLVETNPKAEPYTQEFVYTTYPLLDFNYNKFLNIGYAIAKNSWPGFFAENNYNKYVVVANNDLIFHENWAEIMIKAMGDNQDLDSTSPLNPGWQFHQNYNEEWRIHRGWGIGHEFCGWLQMYKKDSWDRLFPLDEDFAFWCADNSMTLEMQKLGMVHALISTAKVTHLTSRSHHLIPNGKHSEWTSGMGEILNKKIQEGKYSK